MLTDTTRLRSGKTLQRLARRRKKAKFTGFARAPNADAAPKLRSNLKGLPMRPSTSKTIAAALLLAMCGAASAEAFVFSKRSDAGRVLTEVVMDLAGGADDVASYSDMRTAPLGGCKTLPALPTVSLGTLVSVRRSEGPDRFIAAVFESKATPENCVPTVTGSRVIKEILLPAGSRAKVATMLEPDGARVTWWAERPGRAEFPQETRPEPLNR